MPIQPCHLGRAPSWSACPLSLAHPSVLLSSSRPHTVAKATLLAVFSSLLSLLGLFQMRLAVLSLIFTTQTFTSVIPRRGYVFTLLYTPHEDDPQQPPGPTPIVTTRSLAKSFRFEAKTFKIINVCVSLLWVTFYIFPKPCLFDVCWGLSPEACVCWTNTPRQSPIQLSLHF